VEDFMKKLMDLLQSVVPQRRDLGAPSAEAETYKALPAPGLAHPVDGFAQMRQRLLRQLGPERTPQQAASLMAAELERYSKQVLKPWIAAQQDASANTVAAARLMMGSEGEIVSCLVPRPTDQASFTPAMILDQLQAELAESLDLAENAPVS
jgi:hypothetical protein